jgi:hypothetical protein
MTINYWDKMPPLQARLMIIEEMVRRLSNAVAREWDHAIYRIVRFGGQGTRRFEIFDDAGGSWLGQDWDVIQLSGELRRVMSDPGKGAWFTMVLKLHRSGSATARFDYETKPDFGGEMLAVSGYRTAVEQFEFPRDAAHRPQWYAVLLDEYLTEISAGDGCSRIKAGPYAVWGGNIFEVARRDRSNAEVMLLRPAGQPQPEGFCKHPKGWVRTVNCTEIEQMFSVSATAVWQGAQVEVTAVHGDEVDIAASPGCLEDTPDHHVVRRENAYGDWRACVPMSELTDVVETIRLASFM